MYGYTVTLIPEEVEAAVEQGTARQRKAEQLGCLHEFGFNDRALYHNIQSRGAELAVYHVLGVYPRAFDIESDFSHRHHGDGPLDGPSYDVKWTSQRHGDLFVQRYSHDDWPYISATGELPTFELHGWLFGGEAKQEQWWNPELPWPAYQVPSSLLRDLPSFGEWYMRNRLQVDERGQLLIRWPEEVKGQTA